jgi:CDP-glucose 4,6-dehydratase
MNKKVSFWENKNVLITGYEGFLGSHLTKKLIDLGAKIIGLDIKTFRKETILTREDLTKIKVIQGDVADYRFIKDVIDKNRPEIVFHLAAEAIVENCLKEPLKTFSTNISGTYNLLEACRQNSFTKTIVVASSDKAYGRKSNLPYHETDPLSGNYSYDVSKSCADLLAQTYFKTYNLPVAITRCGNIFGPGDFNLSRLVPETILSALGDKTLTIRSDGKFTRDYIYIDDVVDGYLKIAQSLEKSKLAGEIFNLSCEKPVSVLELVKNIYKDFGKEPDYTISNEVKHEIRDQYLSAQKAQKILNWKAKITLTDGLNKTIDWYRSHFRIIASYKNFFIVSLI